MAEQQPEDGDESAANVARDQAVRAAVTMGVELAVLIGITLFVHHQDALALRARRLRALVRRGRAPGDTGLQVADFRASVSAWDHAERARR
jgi:hypothetical protein